MMALPELYAVLFSWAITLSGYAPAPAPDVALVSHAQLGAMACGGRECKVFGWFPPGNTIYLDDRLNAERSVYHASVVVHEFTHYLQQQSGKWSANYSCGEAVEMEREAYGVQAKFLVAHGVYQPVGVSLHLSGCKQQT